MTNIIKFKSTNIRFAFLFTLIFLVTEQLYRLYNPALTLQIKPRGIIALFVLFLFISYFRNVKIQKAVLWFLATVYLIQMIHFQYFGAWIAPLEIYLFFTHTAETLRTLNSDLSIAVVPLLLFFLNIAGIHLFYNKQYPLASNRFASLILIALLSIGTVEVFIKHKQVNFKIQKNDYIVETTWTTLNNFLGYILPCKIFGRCFIAEVPQKHAYKIDTPITGNYNVVLIIGESLRRDMLSLYGYQKKTTPHLDQLATSKHFLYKKAISAGVFTDVSIPCILNCLDRPNEMQTILSQNTCLFHLAKENGFSTAFISAQSHDALNSITSTICLNQIDRFKEAYNITEDVYAEAPDTFLIDEFQKIDLDKGKHFIVLHQNGSHSPYTTKYPKQFARFGEKSLKNQYANSVLFTDNILSRLINILHQSTTPTIVLFTSDHGESLGENGITGHGNYHIDVQHKVPFFLYTIHTDLPDTLKRSILKSPKITHYQISKIVAKLLGFSIDHEEPLFQKQIYILGKDLNGLDGYKILPHHETAQTGH